LEETLNLTFRKSLSKNAAVGRVFYGQFDFLAFSG